MKIPLAQIGTALIGQTTSIGATIASDTTTPITFSFNIVVTFDGNQAVSDFTSDDISVSGGNFVIGTPVARADGVTFDVPITRLRISKRTTTFSLVGSVTVSGSTLTIMGGSLTLNLPRFVFATITATPSMPGGHNYQLFVDFDVQVQGDLRNQIRAFTASRLTQSGNTVVIGDFQRTTDKQFRADITSGHTSGTTTFSIAEGAFVNLRGVPTVINEERVYIVPTTLTVNYAPPTPIYTLLDGAGNSIPDNIINYAGTGSLFLRVQGISGFRNSIIELSGDTDVVSAGRPTGEGARIRINFRANQVGTITIRLHTTSGLSNTVTINFNTFSPVNATITPPPLPVTARTASAVVRFSAVVANFATDDIAVSNDDDGNITINSTTAYTGDGARTGQDYFINFGIAAGVMGRFQLGFADDAMVTVGSQSVGIRVGSVQPITYNTIPEPVNATITPPTLPVRTLTASSIVRFDAVVSDFTLSDLVKSGDPDENITLNSITAYTGDDARTGQDYFVNYSIAVDKTGLFELGFATDAAVTVNSQSASVNVGSVRPVTYDTLIDLTATFGTPSVDSIARTIALPITFASAINVASFTSANIALTVDTGEVIFGSIAQVNSGSSDTEFIINFTMPEDVTGTASVGIMGKVTKTSDSVSRSVAISQVDIEYTTYPSTISPVMTGHTGTKTGDFSTTVNFLNNQVSGFDMADVEISLSGVSVSVIPLGSGMYRLDFTGLPSQADGNFTLDLVGVVTVGTTGDRSIFFENTFVLYDTRTPITATWIGTEGVKDGDFEVRIDFAGLVRITGFHETDIAVGYVSGDTLDSAFNGYTLTADSSGNDYTLAFTLEDGVSGVFSLDITGRVGVSESGIIASRLVSIPIVQIAYNTTATETSPGRALAVISAPERPLGVLADQPISEAVTFDIVWDRDTGTEFTVADIRIHESSASGPRQPLPNALRNVGTAGTTTHFRLTYQPLANSQGHLTIEIIQNAFGSNLPAQSPVVEYNTRPPQIPPEPIWAIPDGIVSDATAPFDVDLNFGENVIGLTIGDFIIEGIENHTTLLYKVIDDVESLHSDNTPASIFRLKIIPRARQIGTMSIILLRDAVTAVDDTTPGPESNSQSPPIQYDTVPMPEPEPEPVFADWVSFPAVIDMLNQDYDFDLQFSRAVTGFNLSDIDVFGVQGNMRITLYKVVNGVESFHIDPNDAASLYRIKFRLIGQQEGIVWFSVSSGSVIAEDTGTGPPVSVTSPGVPYDTLPEVVAPVPPTAVWENIPVAISQPNTDIDIDLNFGRNITGLTLADIIEEGVTNRSFSLFRVVNNVETLHADDTPASLFRLKVRINANQTGNVSFLLKRNSVVSVDDDAMGPVIDVLSPSIPYDTRTPTIPPPVISSIGTRLMRPGGRITIALDTLITGQVNDGGVAISQHPSWITLGSGSGVNRTIAIAPPANTPYTAEDFVITATGPGGSDTERVYVYVEPEVMIPDPVAQITIDAWNVPQIDSVGDPYIYTAIFSEPIANTVAELRDALDVEGITIDISDTSLVEIEKAADNLSATITVNAPNTFRGVITVGIEEDDLLGTGVPQALSFRGQTIRDLVFTAGTAITPVILPQATGGSGGITYTLSPTIGNGLNFNGISRRVSGTPTAVADAITYTFTATDSDGTTVTLTFTITVAAMVLPAPQLPTSLSVVAEGQGGLRATWTAPASGPTPTYQIRWKKATDSSYGNPVAETGTSHLISGLDPNTAYDVQIRSLANSQQSAWTTAVQATTAMTPMERTFNFGRVGGSWSATRTNFRSLAAIVNTLYGYNSEQGNLWTIDRNTGDRTRITPSGQSDVIDSIFVINNTLYAWGRGQLYQYNTTTGRVTQLARPTGSIPPEVRSAAVVGDQVYFTYNENSNRIARLYVLDFTTRVFRNLGDIDGSALSDEQFYQSSALQINAMVAVDNQLYVTAVPHQGSSGSGVFVALNKDTRVISRVPIQNSQGFQGLTAIRDDVYGTIFTGLYKSPPPTT